MAERERDGTGGTERRMLVSPEGAGVLMLLAGVLITGYFVTKIAEAASETSDALTGAIYLGLFVLFGVCTALVGWRMFRTGSDGSAHDDRPGRRGTGRHERPPGGRP